MVNYPNFIVILGWIVGIVNLFLIDFNIKVGNENDNKIISDIIQTSIRVYSALTIQNHYLSNVSSIKKNGQYISIRHCFQLTGGS